MLTHEELKKKMLNNPDVKAKYNALEKEREYKDLDHLFGSWSEEEFNNVHKKISSERKIDQELWQ
jgi:hypothetical protein